MIWRSALFLALVAVATVSPSATSQAPGENACQACRSIMSLTRKFNSSTHRQEYKDLFKNFCELYYPVSTDFQQGPCPIFVDGLFYVVDRTDPIHHCDQIGACGPVQPSDDIYDYMNASNGGASGTMVYAQPERGDEVICTFCKNLIDQVKASLSNPKTVEELTQQADAFCEYLTVIDPNKECRQIMKKYLDTAVLFIQMLDSSAYCNTIKMCPTRRIRATPNEAPQALAPAHLPTLVEFNNFGIETSVSIGSRPIDSAAVGHKNGAQCSICKTIVKEMFHFIRENKTETNIIHVLERICHTVYPTGQKREQCDSMVKAYTREIVQLVIDETDPELICMLLEQCAYDSGTTRQIASPAKPQTTVQPNSNFDLASLISALDTSIEVKSLRACVECKMFIRYLRDKLDDQKSQEQLRQWLLDNLCQELPDKELVNSCTTMVEAYSEIFFKAVVGTLNPQSACAELGVCSARSIVQVFQSGQAMPKRPSVKPAVENERAEWNTRCADVVSRIDDYLSWNTLPEDITALWRVCDKIENPLVQIDCVSITKQHGADIVQKIATMESPRQLCKELVSPN